MARLAQCRSSRFEVMLKCSSRQIAKRLSPQTTPLRLDAGLLHGGAVAGTGGGGEGARRDDGKDRQTAHD